MPLIIIDDKRMNGFSYVLIISDVKCDERKTDRTECDHKRSSHTQTKVDADKHKRSCSWLILELIWLYM